LLLEEDAEPFGGIFVGFREGEGARRDAAAVARNGESDGGEIGRVIRADDVNGGSALAVDPAAVDGIKGPGAVEGETSGRADSYGGDADGIEGFDGIETDVGEDGNQRRGRHGRSLAGESDGRRVWRVQRRSHRLRWR